MSSGLSKFKTKIYIRNNHEIYYIIKLNNLLFVLFLRKFKLFPEGMKCPQKLFVEAHSYYEVIGL